MNASLIMLYIIKTILYYNIRGTASLYFLIMSLQYFSDPMVGGSNLLADSCPFKSVSSQIHVATSCTSVCYNTPREGA